MTPSEELAATQELQGNKNEILGDATKESDKQITSSASSSSNAFPFRVKQVSEINQIAEDAVCEGSTPGTSQNNGKRKLPSWMITSNDIPESDCSNDNKRLKSSESDLEVASSSNAEVVEGSKNEGEQPDSANAPSSGSSEKTEIKTETPVNLNRNDDPQSSSAAQQNGSSNPVVIKPAVSVKKEEATSTSRESCKFGIRCYRRNPMHRIEEAHPGDQDYKRPNFPTPPKGTPDCPYGDSCYRRNPTHFQQFYHPPETDFEQNWKNYRMRLRQRRQAQNTSTTNNDDNSDLDDYDLEDPFINDGDDEDYIPSGDDEDADYDDCDKAEE